MARLKTKLKEPKRMISRAFENVILSSVLGGNKDNIPSNYYVGLCNNIDINRDMTLADLSETTGTGYARQSISGWQEPKDQPDCQSIRSNEVIFKSTGETDDWSGFSRMFLTDSESGTTGKLLAISTAMPNDVSLKAGASYPAVFELYLK